MISVEQLPTINASLNACAAVLLWFGRRAIKQGNRKRHIQLMISALVVSGLFLCCYLYYHAHHGSTRYEGQGVLRLIYFFILMTHIPLAGLVPPMSLLAVWFGWKKQFDRHVKLTKWLWPIWMYVSVTGVLIYLMLYQF